MCTTGNWDLKMKTKLVPKTDFQQITKAKGPLGSNRKYYNTATQKTTTFGGPGDLVLHKTALNRIQ